MYNNNSNNNNNDASAAATPVAGALYPVAIESRPPGTDSDVAEIARVVGCMNEFPCTIHKLRQTGRMRGRPAVARARSVPQGERQREAVDGTRNFRNRRQATVYRAFSGVGERENLKFPKLHGFIAGVHVSL